MSARLEQDLYRAFEQSDRPVLSRASLNPLRGQGSDPYEAHHKAAVLLHKVEGLRPLLRDLIQAKYGRRQAAFAALCLSVEERHALPAGCGKYFAAHWLRLKGRPQLKDLVGTVAAHKSTISKKCRKIELDLDGLNRLALEQLSA
ncbi:hypothetical protein V9W64_10905 [Neisseria leonii]|uniref:Uncharacterized protein n=1 Tax=Neisseria leonii TaxID=2995413 RepID=A0A9X4DZQ7_9NEIS|nr:hypothetical protein [Neisseria sp. 51.81]MDD9326751.1 hypothetical protein [Neisseria sp. 51.81]